MLRLASPSLVPALAPALARAFVPALVPALARAFVRALVPALVRPVIPALTLTLVLVRAAPVRAGELDLNLGLQATHTGWPDDRGGGPTLSAGWWFSRALGASFIGKTHYASVDERYLSYFSINAAARHDLGRVRLGGTLGVVHEHEETRAAIEAMPLASAFGVADGIRHRMAARAGASLALPFRDRARGDWYVALDLDATVFADDDRGPRWMTSAGLAIGFTHDFGVRR